LSTLVNADTGAQEKPYAALPGVSIGYSP